MPNEELDPEDVPGTYQEIQAMIFNPMCAQQCHNGGAAPKGLALEQTRSLANLVGVPSVELPTMMRVAPGAPEASYLIVKLVAIDSRRIGSRMPRNGPPFVSSKAISAIKRWISAGASGDWVDGDADAPDAGEPPDAADPQDAGIEVDGGG